jgi:hypothetical protein
MKTIQTKQFKEAQNFFEKTEALNTAISSGDITKVQELLERGYSPDQNSMSVAMQTGNPDMSKLVREAYRKMMMG